MDRIPLRWSFVTLLGFSALACSAAPTGHAAKNTEPTPTSNTEPASISKSLDANQPTEIQPEFRTSFTKCWGLAKDEPSRRNCIKPELEYQDAALNQSYKDLHRALSEKEWLQLRDEQRQWVPTTHAACTFDSRKWATHSDADYCLLYRTALRAYELSVMLSLEKE